MTQLQRREQTQGREQANDRVPVEGRTQEMVPVADLWETDTAFWLRLDLPGVKEDSVDVTLERDTLIVKAERPLNNPVGYRLWHQELYPARFERTFRINVPVARDELEAVLEAGVLTIKLSKGKEAQPTKVRVKAA